MIVCGTYLGDGICGNHPILMDSAAFIFGVLTLPLINLPIQGDWYMVALLPNSIAYGLVLWTPVWLSRIARTHWRDKANQPSDATR